MNPLNKELLKNITVLYVEDEDDVRKEVSYFCKNFIPDFHTAKDGIEGINLFHQIKPDIIITDIQMPKKNGLEMIRELNTNVPVIVTTAHSDSGFLLEAVELHITKFNIKPLKLDKLLHDIQDIISHSILKAELFEKDNLLNIVDENVLISITDKNGIVIDASSAFCNFVKYSKDELLGENHKKLRHPDTPDSFYENMWEIINSKQVFKSEVKNLNKAGEIYWAMLTITPVVNDSGEIINFTAIRQDITNKKKLEATSIEDSLTKLYNRRYFNKIIEKEIRRVKRSKSIISLMCIDIDNFKKYNDYYGHPAGDKVLEKTSACFKKIASRASDFVFRMGGEEFCIIASETSCSETVDFVSRVITEVENLKIEHNGNDVSDYVTVSAGLIVLESNKIIDSKQLYQLADDALYKAKNEGRNRLVLSDKSSNI